MAKAKLDPLFSSISGTMGDVVFRRSKRGEVIIARRPRKSNAPLSKAQLANQQRFAEASKYASAALADSDLRAVYEEIAAQEGISAYAAARADYFKGKARLA